MGNKYVVSCLDLFDAFVFVVFLFLVKSGKGGNFNFDGLFVLGSLLRAGGKLDLFSEFSDVADDGGATLAVHVFSSELGKVFFSGHFVDQSVGSQVSLGNLVLGKSGVLVLGGFLTFLGGSDINFVALESSNLLVDDTQEPGSSADTSGFKAKGNLEEDVDKGVGQELNREGRSNQLPGNGGKNGGDKGSQESKVEQLLDRIRDSEDVLINSNFVGNSGDTGNDEEAKGDSQLTTDHESRQVAATSFEQAVADLLGENGISSVLLGDLSDGEESNLHTLKHTNNTHEQDEKDDRDSSWNTFPHGSASSEKSFKSDGKRKDKDGNGHQTASPEEDSLKTSLGSFVGLDGLSSKFVGSHLDQVTSVHETSHFNDKSDIESKGHEVCVDVVKHAVRGVNLSSELSNSHNNKHHGNTRTEEDVLDDLGHSESISSLKRRSAKVDSKVDEDNHELTSHEVSVEVVSLV
jgi:hypothetical protein